MIGSRSWRVVQWVLACAIGVTFLYAAKFKIADPADFAQSIKHYRILPLALVNGLAILLPWWEISAGIGILIPQLRRASAGILFSLTTVFAAAVVSAMVRGLDITCGCFGQHSTKAGLQTLVVDILVLLATGLLLWYRPKQVAAPAKESSGPG